MEMVHFIPPSQRKLVMLAAQADTAPALICGASGTGRGAIAHWIHLNGPRSVRPFLTANRDHHLIEQLPEAQGGSLVIPEIGEWPLSEQMVLLNYLNTKSIPHPTSESMKMLLNVRIIATTSQTLEGRAQGGLFNSDLLKKLNVFRIDMPPLSKRLEEFEDIATGILSEIVRELHKEHIRKTAPTALEKLKSYEWPGNLRELRNVLKMAVLSCREDKIELSDLPPLGDAKINYRASREAFEKIYITELLRTHDWNVHQASEVSRMDAKLLKEKIAKYQIEMPSPL